MMNLKVTVHNRDLLESDLSDLPLFDIVYSLGFIEHFNDLNFVVERHVARLKEGGLLMLGVPNYSGIMQVVLKRLAPKMLSMHNLETMDTKTWASFEKKYQLDTAFRGYIGGFEPRIFRRCEDRTLTNLAIRFLFKMMRLSLTDRVSFLRIFNSPYWSAYVLGIYKKRS
jgi:2-polyprenyl-3-methyl-5-hydroxy-6-metoxy-1,4-benzoquinol methylase